MAFGGMSSVPQRALLSSSSWDVWSLFPPELPDPHSPLPGQDSQRSLGNQVSVGFQQAARSGPLLLSRELSVESTLAWRCEVLLCLSWSVLYSL